MHAEDNYWLKLCKCKKNYKNKQLLFTGVDANIVIIVFIVIVIALGVNRPLE